MIGGHEILTPMGMDQSRVETPREREYQVKIPIEDASLISRLVQGDERYGSLAHKFPIVPEGTQLAELMVVTVGLTNAHLAVIGEALRRDCGAMDVTDYVEWFSANGEKIRRNMSVFLDLLERVYEAGGPRNEALIEQDETLIRLSHLLER